MPDHLPPLRRIVSLLSPPVSRRARGRQDHRGQPCSVGASPADRWALRRGNPRRHHTLGSALVQALMVGLIAVIAACLLASRLLASRFNSFSRSDSLAAREAAEYGLNELQATLNSNLYSYLWVTKQSAWSSVTLTALNTCGVVVLDSSGSDVTTLPSLPQGISSARTIRSDNNITISYKLLDGDSGFKPPELPDSSATTAAQTGSCGSASGSASAAANFGNLRGGSAILSVRGTINRDGRITNVTMKRSVHVVPAAKNLRYSFIILGNSYNSSCTPATDFYKCTPDPKPITPATLGTNSDIAKLNVLDGNFCYGTSNGCSPTTPIDPTVIGCVDLDSCLVNNVDTVDGKIRDSYCLMAYKVKRSRARGVICNSFQQAMKASEMPPVITLPANQSWDALSRDSKCDPKMKECENYDGTINGNMLFPYWYPLNTAPASAPTSLAGMTNANLVHGCYFNNTNGSKTASATGSTAINCLIRGKEIRQDGKVEPLFPRDRNLVVQTDLLPVNFFLWQSYDAATGKRYAYSFDGAGIENSDTSESGWARLRILGRSTADRKDGNGNSYTPCDQTTIISARDNDFKGVMIWLPNGSLNYQRTGSNDTSYAVIWVCKFTAPVKGTASFTIATPRTMDALVRENLTAMLPGFAKAAGGTYRGYGAKDSTL